VIQHDKNRIDDLILGFSFFGNAPYNKKLSTFMVAFYF